MAASNPSAGTNRIRFSGLAGFPLPLSRSTNVAAGTPLEHRQK